MTLSSGRPSMRQATGLAWVTRSPPSRCSSMSMPSRDSVNPPRNNASDALTRTVDSSRCRTARVRVSPTITAQTVKTCRTRVDRAPLRVAPAAKDP